MADEARLSIVIEEPRTAPGAAPGGSRPVDELPSWYPRYRELRNRADMGQSISPGERAELDGLSRKLTEFADTPVPAAPPVITFRPPTPAPPGWAVPPAAADEPAAPTADELDDLRAIFGMMGGGAAPPAATFRPPSPAPPGWAVPPSVPPATYQPPPVAPAGITYHAPSPAPPGWAVPAAGGGQPPPLPPPPAPPAPPPEPGAGGPGFPGWENAYRSTATSPGRFGDPAGFAGSATAAQGEYVAGQRQAHTDRLNREFRDEIAQGEAARAESAAAFDAATASMPGWGKAAVGAAAGTAEAAAVGGSLSAGAASGAMAAAGGPIGLALAANELKEAITGKVLDSIKGLGDAAKKAAGNDHLGLFQDATGKAVGALEKLPIAGETIALPLKVAATAATAFTDAANAFVARGRELSGLSAPLAGAAAYQDVRGYQADVREAQELGPGLGELTRLMTDLSVTSREALLPIKQVVVEVLTGAAMTVKELAQVVLSTIRELPLVSDEIKEWAKRVLGALEGDTAVIDPIEDWLKAADGLGAGPAIPGGAVRPGADAITPLPIFSR
ncbi:MAG: hypothetical protein U0804_28780 [Gemmataceae bacterium]